MSTFSISPCSGSYFFIWPGKRKHHLGEEGEQDRGQLDYINAYYLWVYSDLYSVVLGGFVGLRHHLLTWLKIFSKTLGTSRQSRLWDKCWGGLIFVVPWYISYWANLYFSRHNLSNIAANLNGPKVSSSLLQGL
jgi:hypothetical protein